MIYSEIFSAFEIRMASGVNGITLQRELHSLKKDLILYSKAADGVDILNAMNVTQTIEKLEAVIPMIESLLDGATSKEMNRNEKESCFHFVQTILCSELALFSPQ